MNNNKNTPFSNTNLSKNKDNYHNIWCKDILKFKNTEKLQTYNSSILKESTSANSVAASPSSPSTNSSGSLNPIYHYEDKPTLDHSHRTIYAAAQAAEQALSKNFNDPYKTKFSERIPPTNSYCQHTKNQTTIENFKISKQNSYSFNLSQPKEDSKKSNGNKDEIINNTSKHDNANTNLNMCTDDLEILNSLKNKSKLESNSSSSGSSSLGHQEQQDWTVNSIKNEPLLSNISNINENSNTSFYTNFSNPLDELDKNEHVQPSTSSEELPLSRENSVQFDNNIKSNINLQTLTILDTIKSNAKPIILTQNEQETKRYPESWSLPNSPTQSDSEPTDLLPMSPRHLLPKINFLCRSDGKFAFTGHEKKFYTNKLPSKIQLESKLTRLHCIKNFKTTNRMTQTNDTLFEEKGFKAPKGATKVKLSNILKSTQKPAFQHDLLNGFYNSKNLKSKSKVIKTKHCNDNKVIPILSHPDVKFVKNVLQHERACFLYQNDLKSVHDENFVKCNIVKAERSNYNINDMIYDAMLVRQTRPKWSKPDTIKNIKPKNSYCPRTELTSDDIYHTIDSPKKVIQILRSFCPPTDLQKIDGMTAIQTTDKSTINNRRNTKTGLVCLNLNSKKQKIENRSRASSGNSSNMSDKQQMKPPRALAEISMKKIDMKRKFSTSDILNPNDNKSLKYINQYKCGRLQVEEIMTPEFSKLGKEDDQKYKIPNVPIGKLAKNSDKFLNRKLPVHQIYDKRVDNFDNQVTDYNSNFTTDILSKNNINLSLQKELDEEVASFKKCFNYLKMAERSRYFCFADSSGQIKTLEEKFKNKNGKIKSNGKEAFRDRVKVEKFDSTPDLSCLTASQKEFYLRGRVKLDLNNKFGYKKVVFPLSSNNWKEDVELDKEANKVIYEKRTNSSSSDRNKRKIKEMKVNASKIFKAALVESDSEDEYKKVENKCVKTVRTVSVMDDLSLSTSESEEISIDLKPVKNLNKGKKRKNVIEDDSSDDSSSCSSLNLSSVSKRKKNVNPSMEDLLKQRKEIDKKLKEFEKKANKIGKKNGKKKIKKSKEENKSKKRKKIKQKDYKDKPSINLQMSANTKVETWSCTPIVDNTSMHYQQNSNFYPYNSQNYSSSNYGNGDYGSNYNMVNINLNGNKQPQNFQTSSQNSYYRTKNQIQSDLQLSSSDQEITIDPNDESVQILNNRPDESLSNSGWTISKRQRSSNSTSFKIKLKR